MSAPWRGRNRSVWRRSSSKLKSDLPSSIVSNPPGWTIRSVLFALMMTGAVFVLLPLTEQMSRRPEPDLRIREVKTVRIPPPLKPPPAQAREKVRPAQNSNPLPEPVIQKTTAIQPSFKIPVDLQPGVEKLRGNYENSFQIEGAQLVSGMAAGIFEIADLDRPPRPLVRVNPLYPPQARMRRVEGYVTVEFVVGINGEIQELDIIESEPGEVFVRAVERAVKGWRFEAGEIQGTAVPARVRQRIDFNLD